MEHANVTKASEIANQMMRLAFEAENAGSPTAAVAMHKAETARRIAIEAEAFVRAAEWLADNCKQAARKVRECDDLSTIGCAASDVRSTSLMNDVPGRANKLQGFETLWPLVNALTK